MNIIDLKGLTNAQIALVLASELGVAINGKEDSNWDEEDVLNAARAYKKFLDGDEEEFDLP